MEHDEGRLNMDWFVNISALVVDDERLARIRLRRLLTEQGVDVIGEGVDGQQAIDLVNQMPVDMLFIDINMPNKNGLAAAKEITSTMQRPPTIVFCTAYDEYALQAFETNASAYLLKPISAEDLAAVILRAGQLSQMQVTNFSLRNGLGEGGVENSSTATLAISCGDSKENIAVSEIEYFRSVDKHVYACIKNRGEVLVDNTLKQLQVKLAPAFVRTHRSSLVNVLEIAKLTRTPSGKSFIHLNAAGVSLPVSRRHLAEVKKCFQ